MSNTIEFPGLSLVEIEPAQPAAASSPAITSTVSETPASGPKMGRRWSDGAGTSAPVDPNAPWSMVQQWPNLVAALSEQAVESSNLLLRALNYLVGAGRLRRSEAKALSDAMHQLRGTSLRAQQITRLAGGRIRQARERVDLSELVAHVVQDRAGEIEAAGVSVTSDLQPVDVLLDPPVAISLINAILDWGMSFSKQLHLILMPATFGGPAQLKVRVATPPPAALAAQGTGAGWTVRPRSRRLNDGLHWMLLRQIATSSSLEVTRTPAEGAAILTIDFPKAFLSTEGMACLELTDHTDPSAPLRDAWVLVLVGDDKVRQEAVDALRKMGIDAVAASNPMQARTVIGETRPNVLVTSWDVPADDVATFRRDVLGGEERCPMVEITRELPSFHLSGFDRFETPKVGLEQLTAELPPTVLFELVKIV